MLVANADDPPALLRIDQRTGKQRVLSSGGLFAAPSDVTISPSGRIFVSDYSAFGGTGGVIEVDPVSGEQTKVSANDQPINVASQLFNSPAGITLLRSGTLLVVDRGFASSEVIAVDPATGKQTILSSNSQPDNVADPLFGDLRGGIAVLRSGTVLVSNSAGPSSGLIAIDLGNGKQSRFSTNDQPVNAATRLYDLPVGIVELRTGGIFVADQNGPTSASTGPYSDGGVIAADPATGRQSSVSHNQQPINAASRHFSDPFDIAVGFGERLLVVDPIGFSGSGCTPLSGYGCGGVIGVDPATGKQRVVSSNEQRVNASSHHFERPDGIAVVPLRCFGRVATITGTPKAERIAGTAGGDVIAALGGEDKVLTKGGNDLVCAGGGPDAIRGGKGADWLRGEGGRDDLFGGPGRDRLFGGKGVDLLKGGPGRDLLRGGPGPDRQVR